MNQQSIPSLCSKDQFPIFNGNGRDLCYLDSAGTAQKPALVLDALQHFYRHSYANIHRGVYPLADQASEAYESARQSVADFLHAPHKNTIVFTRNATEAINLVAYSYAMTALKKGDIVVLTEAEHHANILPWQMVRDKVGIILKVAPLDRQLNLDLASFEEMITGAALVTIPAMSNVTGALLPVKEIIKSAHGVGAKILIDAAQWAAHGQIDVQELDCDFLAFTGHKIYGPDGIGALYAKAALLELMPPFLQGGGMIQSVNWQQTVFADPPHRFEAGTPAIGAAIGLAEAIRFIQRIGFDQIREHDQALLCYAKTRLKEIDGLRLIGDPIPQQGILSFLLEGVHPHDAASILGNEGICVRAGHHCAQPLMDMLGVPGTIRISFGVYNDSADIDMLISGLHKVRRLFSL